MTIDGYNLLKLSHDNIAEAKCLCDICIGEGMYTDEYLQHIISQPEHLFYLVKDDDKFIGFHYCYCCSVNEAANLLKLPEEALTAITGNNICRTGIFKSVGILSEYRCKGLAGKLIRYFENEIFDEFEVNTIFVPTWKHDDNVPAQNPLMQKGYKYLCDAYNVWYDVETLRCPACKQIHCVCAASIFYKKRGL